MKQRNDLTTGSVTRRLVTFALPYLLAAFLQTFYGLADLFVVGLYNASETTTAVAVGSQVMHLFTVVVLGLAMGSTVLIGKAIGAKDEQEASKVVGSTVLLFTGVAFFLTILLEIFPAALTRFLSTPEKSVAETISYLRICGGGLPFIVAYNVISSIYRGAGDSKRPLLFVAIACVINVALDFVFVGIFGMGAKGAAIATITGQAVSVIVALLVMKKVQFGCKLSWEDVVWNGSEVRKILSVGVPVALQDGFIQVAFIIITKIANERGLLDATAVGIVEKIICFLFLVPSSFLSAISAISAQNMGAGKKERAKKSLYVGLAITASWGALWALFHQICPQGIVQFFSKDAEVVAAGAAYIKSYSIDIFFAAVHFCFSGYFCGIQKSSLSFIHNAISIVLIRVPGTYFFSKWWPGTLYPMGLAAPIGSLLSAALCVIFYVVLLQKEKREEGNVQKF